MDEEDTTNNYRIKDIKFFGSHRRILLQSANGPCPLLALCNVLLLRNALTISSDTRYISFSELVQMVSNHLFDVNASSMAGGDSSPAAARAANVRENLDSCLEVLPKLNVGLDVNVKFAGCAEFEYTKELAVFDLLDIGLFHGWVVSKQDQKAFAAFGHLSYNQIVEKIIGFSEAQQSVIDSSAQKAAASAPGADGAASGLTGEAPSASSRPWSPTSDPVTQKTISDGMIIQEFWDRTGTQLSYDGLVAMHEAVRERELAVFFRNSHFSCILKYSGDLYLLCTDISFSRSVYVWERLDEVDGDTAYVDADFQEVREGDDNSAAIDASQAAGVDASAAAQSDADAMLAWQMMQEDLQAQERQDHAVAQGHAAPVHVPGAVVANAAPPPGRPAAPAGPGALGMAELPPAPPKKGAKEKKRGKSCSVQ